MGSSSSMTAPDIEIGEEMNMMRVNRHPHESECKITAGSRCNGNIDRQRKSKIFTYMKDKHLTEKLTSTYLKSPEID